MKSLLDYVRSCGGEGAGAPGGSDNLSAKDQGRKDPTAGRVKRVAGKGLWQDVEYVPKIVEKIGE
ncbi:MAG: hypothetical protein ACYC99_06950 [Candidatus Geothermincolia bacterium]